MARFFGSTAFWPPHASYYYSSALLLRYAKEEKKSIFRDEREGFFSLFQLLVVLEKQG